VKTQDYMGVACPLNRKCLNHAGLWAKLLNASNFHRYLSTWVTIFG